MSERHEQPKCSELTSFSAVGSSLGRCWSCWKLAAKPPEMTSPALPAQGVRAQLTQPKPKAQALLCAQSPGSWSVCKNHGTGTSSSRAQASSTCGKVLSAFLEFLPRLSQREHQKRFSIGGRAKSLQLYGNSVTSQHAARSSVTSDHAFLGTSLFFSFFSFPHSHGGGRLPPQHG